MVGFWFKKNYADMTYLFSLSETNNQSSFIYVYVDTSNYLHLVIEDTNNVYVGTTRPINLAEWNYLGIEYYDDGNEKRIILELNEETREGTITLTIPNNLTYHIGYKYYNGTKTGAFSGGISNLMIGHDVVAKNYIYSYYLYTKNYIYQNQIEEFQNTPYVSTSSFTDVSNINYDLIPLENNFKSINGISELRFDVNQNILYDSSKIFAYNSVYKRYNYLAYGNKLVYDFDFTNTGTIIFKGSILEKKEKQYFLTIKNEFGSFISLYRNSNLHLILEYGNSSIDTNQILTNSQFTIGISYEEVPNSSYKNIKVFVGTNTTTHQIILNELFTDTKIYIGLDSNFNNPLMGMIMDIYYKNTYISSIPSFITNLKEYHKNQYYDSFGRFKEYIIYQNNTELLKTTYSFKTRSDDTYTSLLVNKEEYTINNTNYERNYTLDNLGKVVSISDLTFGSHTYSYNNLGYLVSDDNKSITYDINGNVLTYGTNTYTYDNLSRLVSYNNNQVTYNNTKKFLMETFNGYTYTYQGKRLISVTKNNKTVNYTYDIEGLIIKKEVIENNITTTTNYYYENRNLIKEVRNTTTIDYFYDNNNQLYGYKENNNVYFYIRDVLGNIIGIIDNSGQILSKFIYDAYGNIINQTGAIISNFRYKGYYYDTDIELYYLKSRFYNPILLRFITPDSIEYIDSTSIVGLNLYSYCGNDPINMVDEEGNICFLACLAIGAVVGAVVGFGTSLASEIISNGGDSNKVNWGIVASGTVFGAIDGALSVTGLGPVASVAISGALAGIQYTVEQAISGDEFNINSFFLSVGIGAIGGALMPDNFDAKKMTGIYKTSKDYLKTLVSKSKRAMYNGKIKGVYKTIAKKSALYAIGSATTNASDEGSKYIFEELLGWL